MTFGGLTFDLTKNDWSSFVIMFDALSNSAYRVSQDGPGAELKGVFKYRAGDRRVLRRSPARRGLRKLSMVTVLFGDICTVGEKRHLNRLR